MEYIEIEKELVPYRFEVSLADTVFTFEVQYNSEYDFFTVDLERDGEVLVTAEKITYGVPLFSGIADERFPEVELFPFDESGSSEEVTWATFGETVFLYVLDGDDDG